MVTRWSGNLKQDINCLYYDQSIHNKKENVLYFEQEIDVKVGDRLTWT